MMFGRKIFRFTFLIAFLPIIVLADEIPSITITEKTNPKIAELYQQLQNAEDSIKQIQSERVDKLSENYEALKENEQSTANKTLTAATIAATGVGGMELAQGLAEQKADKEADANMDAYLETFTCSYGGGKHVKAGPDEIELPGGNDAELMKLRSEYVALAADLKERKTALGMKPGIESEEILDKATMGLYDDENAGIDGGAYASLYREKMLGSEEDKSKLQEMSDTTKKRVTGGAVAAGAGVIGGIVGNAIINKDAPKNESDKINREYDKKVKEASKEQEDLKKQLNQLIAENAIQVKNYNNQLQQHKDQIAVINQASQNCQELFTDYVSTVSKLSPIENETDSVPDVKLPDISEQKTLLAKCTTEKNTPGQETKPAVEPESEQETIPAVEPEPDFSEDEYCPATDNRLNSINDKTKIGDECSSTNIAGGEVVWHKQLVKGKKVCTCVAYACNDGYHSEKGGCVKDAVKLPNCPRQEYNNVPDIKTGNDALKFCESKSGTQCKTVKAINNYTGVKGKVLCNPDGREIDDAKQRIADNKTQYYNCGQKDAKIPKDITCNFVSDFDSFKVTPMEAEGLMKEWAIKKHKDDIKCDNKTHRTTGIQPEDYRQCISKKNPKIFYEFDFKSLDNGNNGFYGALCAIWGLKSGTNSCKDSNKTQCQEISNVITRTFYTSGNAEMNGTECKIISNEKAESSRFAFTNKLNNKILTKDDIKTIESVDFLHFYDKTLQINADSNLYAVINNYLFTDLGLPVRPFKCDSGFTESVPYYNMSRSQYDDKQKQLGECMNNAPVNAYDGGRAYIKLCQDQYAPTSTNGDLLTCVYDGKPVDFLFKKLDVRWDRKSIGGYQGLHCLSEGGSFTGKNCTLATEQQCKDFNTRFTRDYPNSKGMEWDSSIGEHGACVLKDAKYVGQVQKVAEVTGMVALTLVTSVSGGPIVWALSAVEGAALITEAVTEEKINKWAESFLVDAANCKTNNSNCANAVMKRHIARIIEGSNQFNDTQNKQIAKQTERLLGMIDDKTLSEIVDKGEKSGFIGEERDPDLEKSIRAYYGTQLTSQEKALLVTKKVATVATFATLIGGGIMSGLRQSFKHNLIRIDKVKQARWVDLKILRETDVAADVFAMSKTGQKAASKAGKLATTTPTPETKPTKPGSTPDATPEPKPTKPGSTPDATPEPKPTKPGSTPDATPEPKPTKPGSTPDATPEPKPTKPGSTPDATPEPAPVKPIRTAAEEEAEWKAMYEKYAPANEDFDHFKNAFQNDLDKALETTKSWDKQLANAEQIQNETGQLWTDFHKKYDPDDKTFSYATYSNLRKYAEEHPTTVIDPKTGLKGTEIKYPDLKTPGLESWTEEQLQEAKLIYEKQQQVRNTIDLQNGGFYSTVDTKIGRLKKELQQNTSANVINDLNKYLNDLNKNPNLNKNQIKNIEAYIKGEKFDTQILSETLAQNRELSSKTHLFQLDYKKFLNQKAKNVQQIDNAAGLHAGSQKSFIDDIIKTGGKNTTAKNEFIQNFVSKRVGMYEDIITKNPNIYNRAKAWNQLSIEEKEKLCKEIFEIADTKLGVQKTEFAVKDLVKEFGEAETVTGLQSGGNVYLSKSHFQKMSFADVMDTISHEQAHKVDHLNPNKGILGSQLADLGKKEGYIQGFAGHAYKDYRLELTEQSSWQIGEQMKKLITDLGF